jgi:hypothetical protein
MFRWYQNAARCFVCLTDVSTAADDDSVQWKPNFRKSRWFTRGWTLQDLIAPLSVELFSSEGQLLGYKLALIPTLHEVTGIAEDALKGGSLNQFNVEERLSWAANRVTKCEEDESYSLFGLFDVSMPLIYGEGREKAYRRLLREIEDSLMSPTTRCFPTKHNRAVTIEQIQHWLCAADPSSNYQQDSKQRLERTGLWLIESEQYHKWKIDSASLLWMYDILGSGKDRPELDDRL